MRPEETTPAARRPPGRWQAKGGGRLLQLLVAMARSRSLRGSRRSRLVAALARLAPGRGRVMEVVVGEWWRCWSLGKEERRKREGDGGGACRYLILKLCRPCRLCRLQVEDNKCFAVCWRTAKRGPVRA